MKPDLTIRWWYNTTWDKEVGKIKVKYKTKWTKSSNQKSI